MSKAQEAWDAVFRRHFCPKTNLLYEFCIDEDSDAWHHLPKPEQIRKNIPNPCGWGTGMEDSVMNGHMALDALMWAREGSEEWDPKPLTDRLWEGLFHCRMPDGFVARSLSPEDGESHYIESSRDQYTHWVAAGVRYYRSALCTDEQNRRIREGIVAIAERCERQVTAENGFELLREDGSAGKVCRMWGELGIHEWCRLPMIYLAAWHVTGDEKWKRKYLPLREEMARYFTDDLPPYRTYCYLQMQYALFTIYRLDGDEAFRERLERQMTVLAKRGEEQAIRASRYCRDPAHREGLYYDYRPWNEREPLKQGVFNGYNYDNPAQSERPENALFYPARTVSEGAIIAALCPRRRVRDEAVEAVNGLLNVLDLRRNRTVYHPLYLACASLLCAQNRKEHEKE